MPRPRRERPLPEMPSPFVPESWVMHHDTAGVLWEWQSKVIEAAHYDDALRAHFASLISVVNEHMDVLREHVSVAGMGQEWSDDLFEKISRYAAAVSEHNVELTVCVGLGRYFKLLREIEEGGPALDDPGTTRTETPDA